MEKIFDVIPRIEELEKRQSSLLIPSKELFLTEDGYLKIDNKDLSISGQAEKALSHLAKIPSEFYMQLPARLKATLFNELNKRNHRIDGDKDGGVRLHLLDDREVIGICKHDLSAFSNTKVISAVLDAVPDQMSIRLDDLYVASLHMTYGSLELNILSSSKQREPRPKDFIDGGISILTSSTGEFGTQITTYLRRLVCENGMLVPVLRDTKRLRIKRAKRDGISEEYFMERIGFIARMCWEELDVKLESLRELAQHKVDVEAVLNKIARDLRLNKQLRMEILKALEAERLGGVGTQLDVINILSWVGTHTKDLDLNGRRRIMSEVGTIITERIQRCPHCQSILRMKFQSEMN